MGKRSAGVFERKPRDLYPTPRKAVEPLLPFLPPGCRFIEPCAGAGDLAEVLIEEGHRCLDAYDIHPMAPHIREQDALTHRVTGGVDFFITNPPWSRDILHPLIVHLSDQLSTWLLLDADWMHTKQAIPYLPRLRMIVSVGRVKWEPDSPHTGKDNAVWLNFRKPSSMIRAEFYGRA